MNTRTLLRATLVAAFAMLSTLAALAASDNNTPGHGVALVTLLPSKGSNTVPQLAATDLKLKVAGRPATITQWAPLDTGAYRMEVVLMLDEGARTSLSTQLSYMDSFLKGLPPGSAAAVAYMMNGRALLATPLTTNLDQAASGLRIPGGGPVGINASPYFCLEDLAKNWPSQNPYARRIAVVVTDGIDNYSPRYDPDDPYVQAAIHAAVSNHVLIYPIYWRDRGWFDQTGYAADTGQNLLAQVASSTGGASYWIGLGNPVSIDPYFREIVDRAQHLYVLEYQTDSKVLTGLQNLKLEAVNKANKLTAPDLTEVERAPAVAK